VCDMNSVALHPLCGRDAVSNDAPRQSSCSLAAILLRKMCVWLSSAGVANGAANATTQAIIPSEPPSLAHPLR
jgi:hypothetical protein